jgi:hypothetical protein
VNDDAEEGFPLIRSDIEGKPIVAIGKYAVHRFACRGALIGRLMAAYLKLFKDYGDKHPLTMSFRLPGTVC